MTETKLDRFFLWLENNYGSQVDDPALLKEIFMDDAVFAEELLQTATQSIEQYADEIKRSVADTDRSFYIAVHSLKSTVRSLGMNTAGTYYEEIERKLNEGNALSVTEIESLIDKNTKLQKLVLQMAGFLKH